MKNSQTLCGYIGDLNEMYLFRSVFLVCPMKNVPLVVRRKGDDYTHTPLPTDGEVYLQ